MIPIYRQLADLLREKILEGQYAFGDTLPPERTMADYYRISHLTVRKALSILEEEGIIKKIQGKGTFVCAGNATMDFQVIGGMSRSFMSHGVKLTNQVLYQGLRKAGWKYKKIFDIGEDEDVFECVRVRWNKDQPLAVEYKAVPQCCVPNLLNYDFSVFSFFDIYTRNNIVISSEEQILEVVKALNPQAELLNIPEGDNIFLLTTKLRDVENRIIEYTKVYDNDRHMVFRANTRESRKGS